MNYTVYRLIFDTAVHFGKKTLESAEYTFSADTLFSALCHEALKRGRETFDELLEGAKEGKMLFSDAFPYVGETDTYFLPKPMKRIEAEIEQGNSVVKKAYKKLKYIPAESLEEYLAGRYDVMKGNGIDSLGHFDMKTSASIRGEDNTMPYRVGLYYFNKGNGLYIIFGYCEDKDKELIDGLIDALSYSGLGGERSSGLGRFTPYEKKLPSKLAERMEMAGEQYMTLSAALPRDDELEKAVTDSQYLLIKRSGFIASDTYASQQMRKKDLYVFKSGSCFSSRFEGDVYDVSCGAGSHPVYRYAKPMFIAI